MDRPTRRGLLAGGAATAALLAGCTSTDTGDGGTPTGTPADTVTATATPDQSYEVEMAPAGTVTFDSPPASVTHYFPDYGDMAVALGHGDSVLSMGLPSRFHTSHYDELDGVSFDVDSLTKLNGDSGIDKEVFYELDADLHLVDPKWLVNNSFFGLDEADVEEVRENVAPFLGNTIFRRTDSWHDYRYYTLYEAFEKVAQVHQEEATFEAFREFHDEYVARVQADLPPADARPNALLTFAAADEPEAFYPYRVSDQGTNKKQFHDLGITDALAGTGIEGLSTNDRGQIDYETMLEVDPDSILVRGHETKTEQEFRDTVLAFMKRHEVASDLTAVQEGQVFRGGPIYSGPLHHLFLLERYATGFFPETFSGELFDRERVSDIVTGEN
jgi:iron complex transport system substrate-binding protein